MQGGLNVVLGFLCLEFDRTESEIQRWRMYSVLGFFQGTAHSLASLCWWNFSWLGPALFTKAHDGGSESPLSRHLRVPPPIGCSLMHIPIYGEGSRPTSARLCRHLWQPARRTFFSLAQRLPASVVAAAQALSSSTLGLTDIRGETSLVV